MCIFAVQLAVADRRYLRYLSIYACFPFRKPRNEFCYLLLQEEPSTQELSSSASALDELYTCTRCQHTKSFT